MSSCTSYTLTGLNANCVKSMGGVSDIYIASYDDLWKIEIDGNDMVVPYMHRGTKFYNYKLRRGQASLSFTMNTSENAASYFTNSITMNLGKMDTTKRTEMMALIGQDVIVLAKDNNGKVWFLGKDEPVQVSEASATTGNNRDEANQYTITLTEYSRELPYEVSSDNYEGLKTDWTQEYLTFEPTVNGTKIFLYMPEPEDSEEGEDDDDENPVIVQVSMDKTIWYNIQATEKYNYFATAFGLESFDAGTKIYVRGWNTSFTLTEDQKVHIVCSNSTYVYGNVLSILDGDNFRTINHLPVDPTLNPESVHGEFNELFDSEGCIILINNHPIMLSQNPILSHPTKELTIPVVEPYTNNTFKSMFKNCNLLKQAPHIIVDSDDMGSDTFDEMFYGCSRLSYIRCDNYFFDIYFDDWTYSVASNGTFVTKDPSQWGRGVDQIPDNWIVITK